MTGGKRQSRGCEQPADRRLRPPRSGAPTVHGVRLPTRPGRPPGPVGPLRHVVKVSAKGQLRADVANSLNSLVFASAKSTGPRSYV